MIYESSSLFSTHCHLIRTDRHQSWLLWGLSCCCQRQRSGQFQLASLSSSTYGSLGIHPCWSNGNRSYLSTTIRSTLLMELPQLGHSRWWIKVDLSFIKQSSLSHKMVGDIHHKIHNWLQEKPRSSKVVNNWLLFRDPQWKTNFFMGKSISQHRQIVLQQPTLWLQLDKSDSLQLLLPIPFSSCLLSHPGHLQLLRLPKLTVYLLQLLNLPMRMHPQLWLQSQ